MTLPRFSRSSWLTETGAVQKLRKAFGDNPRQPQVIETLSRKGYRLLAPVDPLPESDRHAISIKRDTATAILRLRFIAIPAILALAASLVIGAVLWLVPWEKPDTESASAGAVTPSIAVLPFTNLSRDAAQQYFADGITDDITTSLAKHPGLLVIARDSAFV